jgi:hypothetical protein
MTKLAIVRALDPTCIHLPAELRRHCYDGCKRTFT